jgi:hypothetical protein
MHRSFGVYITAPPSAEEDAAHRAAWAALNERTAQRRARFIATGIAEEGPDDFSALIVDRVFRRMEQRAARDCEFVARVHARARMHAQLKRWATRSVRRPKREANQ